MATNLPTTATDHPVPPASAATERPVPRWALRLARALPLLALPVCLWRLPYAFNYTMGWREHHDTSLWLSVPYVFGLSVLTELVALAALVLVRPWGEVFPPRVPFVGGRRVPPALVLAPAALACAVFLGLGVDWVLTAFELIDPGAGYTNVWWKILAAVVSGLFLLWGPIITALTLAYYLRRRPARR
ncbi:hypothetical protein [Streptomyces sp. NPDC059063]|uniref:hypothetical protein n=1 Tax=unclassified Streptomyces TaxID=2593676 RepID=UPI00368747B8